MASDRSWAHFGFNLGGLGHILASFWEVLGASWLQEGGSWAILSSKLGPKIDPKSDLKCDQFFDRFGDRVLEQLSITTLNFILRRSQFSFFGCRQRVGMGEESR